MSEHREHHPRAAEQHSKSGGGGLLGTLLTLVAIPVGWFASIVAVLVGVGFALLVRPGTVLWGWLIMGVLTAVGATYAFGWTASVLFAEALTVVVVTLAMVMKVAVDANKGIVAALALHRWMR